jgi:anti-sigma regulatory factor (Ser/Thr protein kinase)
MTTTLTLATGLQAALSRLAQSAADHAALIAACRASVAASDRGDADPLAYVRGLLQERGQLPAPGSSPLLVLANVRTALHMAGWPAVGADGHVIPDREVQPAPWPLREPRAFRDVARELSQLGPDGARALPHGGPCGCLWLPRPCGGWAPVECCPRHEGSWPGGRPGLAAVAVYEARLDGVPAAAREARRWLSRILDGAPAADDAVTALSELVANSAVHSASAGRPASIRLRLAIAPGRGLADGLLGRWLRIEVRDAGPAARIIPGHALIVHDHSPDAESGRGLDIVAALAHSTGRRNGMAWLIMPWRPPAIPGQRGHADVAAKEIA